MLPPLPLFVSKKERIGAFFFLALLLGAGLFIRYLEFQRLIATKYYETTALVLSQYVKRGHFVLKLKTPHFTFYTTSKEDLKDLRDREVRILLIGAKPSFLEYLRGFYSIAYIKGVLPKHRRYSLKESIAKQHHDSYAKELFGALFLATSLSKELRSKLSALGLSHLVAISGFHLGIIVAVVSFLIFYLLYPLWQRWVPFWDLRLFSLLLSFAAAFGYVVFLGFIPSLVRSFILGVAGFVLFYRHMKLLSFELLFWVVGLILTFFPHFFFSIGFWLSVAGVFFIYLYLHHFSFSKWIDFFAINLWVYVMMVPVVHIFFEEFSFYQLLSPLVSMLFVLFYPLSLLLHLIGLGGWLDGVVGLLHSDFSIYHFKASVWFTGLFLLLCSLSIYKKWIIFLALLLDVGFLVHQVAKL